MTPLRKKAEAIAMEILDWKQEDVDRPDRALLRGGVRFNRLVVEIEAALREVAMDCAEIAKKESRAIRKFVKEEKITLNDVSWYYLAANRIDKAIEEKYGLENPNDE